MRALSIEVAAMIVDAAVIQGAEAHEAVLQRVVPLLVHVVVPDYILFTSKPLQKQEGEGEGGVLYSQIQQQVTSSMWRHQLQGAGANWEVAKAAPAAARTSVKMTVEPLIDLLFKSHISKFRTPAYQAFRAHAPPWSLKQLTSTVLAFPVLSFAFFLIKINLPARSKSQF